MLSRFFLERPVFAWVIAIAIMASGLFAILKLPISQYPPHRAAVNRGRGLLSGCFGADGREFGDPDHRAEDDGI